MAADKEVTLTVFKKKEEGENEYSCTSSESEYPFILPEHKVNNIKKKLEDLVGKPEEKG